MAERDVIVLIACLYLCCRCHRREGGRTPPPLPTSHPPSSHPVHLNHPFKPAYFCAPARKKVLFNPYFNQDKHPHQHHPYHQPNPIPDRGHGGRRPARPNQKPYQPPNTPPGNQPQYGQIPSEVLDDVFLAPEMWEGQSRWPQVLGQEHPAMPQMPLGARDGGDGVPERWNTA
jgi:hypothetical protein